MCVSENKVVYFSVQVRFMLVLNGDCRIVVMLECLIAVLSVACDQTLLNIRLGLLKMS